MMFSTHPNMFMGLGAELIPIICSISGGVIGGAVAGGVMSKKVDIHPAVGSAIGAVAGPFGLLFVAMAESISLDFFLGSFSFSVLIPGAIGAVSGAVAAIVAVVAVAAIAKIGRQAFVKIRQGYASLFLDHAAAEARHLLEPCCKVRDSQLL